jgi:exodeoxyribonuclease-3
MRIATWNVNSVRQRLGHLTQWLAETKPDLVCLQELKCQDEAFPRMEIEALGYNCAVLGQKTFNGVALLSRLPLEDVRRGLPGDDSDEQARYIEAVVSVPSGVVRVASIYLPNGNPLGTDKFPYKLRFMDRLISHARELLALEEPLVLAGDYNIIPTDLDAKQPELWTKDALAQPESRTRFQSLKNLGLSDAIRVCAPDQPLYSFWDYQAGAWQKNNGIRIDHLLLSPEAIAKLTKAGIDKDVRDWEKPSDHVPVWVELAI